MKEIPGYEGIYACDEFGKIYSLPRTIKRKNGGDIEYVWHYKLQELKPAIRKDGYLGVSLTKNSISKSKLVHRLIGETFLFVKIDKEINHIDGNKKNNNLNNLEICTRGENIRHAFKSGLRSHRGKNHPQYFVNNEMRTEIRRLLTTGITQQEIGKIVGVNQTLVSDIKLNKFPHRE